MHSVTRLVVAAVLGVAVVAVVVVGGGPVGAGSAPPGRNGGPVTPTDDGYLGRVRQQVNELNRYVSNPQPCHWGPHPSGDGSTWDDGHLPEPLPEGFHNGYWRYRLLREVSADDPSAWAEGMQYVRECWWGQALDTAEEDGWGAGWQAVSIFDAVDPQSLARLALDQFFLGLPAPTPAFSPASPTLVDIETWMWIEGGIPTGEIASRPISVPGLTVQAFARVREVLWEMGDGSKTCPIATTPAAAQALDCTYRYQTSSAAQPGAVYHGSATLIWQGRYTINGAPAPEILPDIPRETPFQLGVAEAQAINNNP